LFGELERIVEEAAVPFSNETIQGVAWRERWNFLVWTVRVPVEIRVRSLNTVQRHYCLACCWVRLSVGFMSLPFPVKCLDSTYLQICQVYLFPGRYSQHSCEPTSRSRDLFDKLIVASFGKKLPAFYGTWIFIAVFTRAHHGTRTSWIQSTATHTTSCCVVTKNPPQSAALCKYFVTW
jgi:hypothetical protein